MRCFLTLLGIDTYQNKREARYQEQLMLTNLFTENKILGLDGLSAIIISIGIILWNFYPKNASK